MPRTPNAPSFSVLITNLPLTTGPRPAWPSYDPRVTGSWFTRVESERKVWKTPAGARRWLQDRSGVEGIVYEDRVTEPRCLT